MPINDDLTISYDIPEDIKQLIDHEFLRVLQNELYMVSNLSLDEYAWESAVGDAGTNGWNVCFGLTCIKTGKKQVFEYYHTLDWYDSDIFDGIIGEMLIEEKLVLPGLKIKYICDALNLQQDEVEQCGKCGKYFLKTQLTEHTYPEIENWVDYRCNLCGIKENHPEENQNANNYYRAGIKTLDAEFKRG